jgi:3-deoxy-manno-octulosonate cytidylyltransferase (CMP-KDO synthetase)
VVQDQKGRALYFSRSPIPYVRDGKPDFSQRPSPFLLHIGMYAYRRSFLMQMAKIPMHPFEKLEKLEQLRVLGAGFSINLGIVEERTMGVDTREDYEKFIADYRRFQRLNAA